MKTNPIYLLNRSRRSTSLTSSTGTLLLSADPLVALLALALAARLRAPEEEEEKKKENRTCRVYSQ